MHEHGREEWHVHAADVDPKWGLDLEFLKAEHGQKDPPISLVRPTPTYPGKPGGPEVEERGRHEGHEGGHDDGHGEGKAR